jgi:DNA-nicking Smr family endonuclease
LGVTGKKEFASKPFSAIKGMQVEVAKSAPAQLPIPAVTNDPDEENLLFFREMAGVKRIRQVRSRLKPEGESKGTGKTAERATLEVEDSHLFLDTLAGMKLDVRFADELPEREEHLRPRLSSRMRQLRRGTIRLDLELDLHGLTRDEALDFLASFITAAVRRGQQAVLVITGKGNNSPDGPVLLSVVSDWLREEGRAMVSEFCPAPSALGGDGAFVVFLKTREDV